MKTYEGKTTPNRVKYVTVNGESLVRKCAIDDSVNAQYDWGKITKGAEILSYSILADSLDENTADLFYKSFLQEKISTLDREGFILTEEDIKEYIEAQCTVGIGSAPWKIV